MATEAMIGYQTGYLIMGSGDTPEFVEIGEVTEVTPGEQTTDRVEVTHYKSPNRRREYISGLIDSGEATVTINWNPGNATDVFLRELQNSGEVRTHRIEFPNGHAVEFDGSILSYTKSIPIDDRMTASFTVAVSGAEEWEAPEEEGEGGEG